jgi:coenzyme F420-0:L-glutamate ligase/coenzyme F420-1:gamma-L-glutamate ligase
MPITLSALANIPEVKAGDDIGRLIIASISESNVHLQSGDIFAIAQKIVSKAENRIVALETVVPGERARAVAEQIDKDPHLVELILRESEEISRMRQGVLVVRHRLGFVSANAGIDRSNVAQTEGGERVLLLPLDPDESAEKIRQTLQNHYQLPLGVVITDSHGRPHRLGTTGVAIGVAGLPALLDKRGTPDRYGYMLQHTDVGIADEIAAAASLLMGQAAESTPIILLHGLMLPPGEGRAADLYRPKAQDLYR